MKVVYNTCFGGFSLSSEATRLARQISNNPLWGGPCLKGDRYPSGEVVDREWSGARDVARDDPILVQVVETLGAKANGKLAELAIRDVPKGEKWRIDEYDGAESVVLQNEYDWKEAT